MTLIFSILVLVCNLCKFRIFQPPANTMLCNLFVHMTRQEHAEVTVPLFQRKCEKHDCNGEMFVPGLCSFLRRAGWGWAWTTGASPGWRFGPVAEWLSERWETRASCLQINSAGHDVLKLDQHASKQPRTEGSLRRTDVRVAKDQKILKCSPERFFKMLFQSHNIPEYGMWFHIHQLL